MKGVRWGRNIYGNVKKFLQFQITCNFAVLVTIVLGTIFLTESPFGATQLIWLNLIMDTLGAMALATAPPLASVIHQPAVTGNVKVLSKTMWRQIYGVAVWMVIVMFLVIWFGRAMYGLDYEKDTQTTTTVCPKVDGSRPDTCEELEMAKDKKIHMTMIFTTFVMLNVFNLVNCRVLGAAEYNIFKKPFNSWIFLLVLVIIFFVQWSATEWFLFLFETAKLSGEQYGKCVLSGLTVWIAAFALKLTPAQWVEKLPIHIDEEEVMGRDSAFMNAYDNQAKGKIPDFRNRNQGINEDDPLTADDDGFHQA